MKIFAVVLVTATASASWVLTRWASSPVWHRVVVLSPFPRPSFWPASTATLYRARPPSSRSSWAAVGATFRPRVSGSKAAGRRVPQ
jgi:hypothetical protein